MGKQAGLYPASKPFAIAADVAENRVIELPMSVSQKKLTVPYKEAVFGMPTDREPHSVSDWEMADIVEKIIEIEGPIHLEEIVARVRILWNLGRAGERIRIKLRLV